MLVGRNRATRLVLPTPYDPSRQIFFLDQRLVYPELHTEDVGFPAWCSLALRPTSVRATDASSSTTGIAWPFFREVDGFDVRVAYVAGPRRGRDRDYRPCRRGSLSLFFFATARANDAAILPFPLRRESRSGRASLHPPSPRSTPTTGRALQNGHLEVAVWISGLPPARKRFRVRLKQCGARRIFAGFGFGWVVFPHAAEQILAFRGALVRCWRAEIGQLGRGPVRPDQIEEVREVVRQGMKVRLSKRRASETSTSWL